MARPLRLAYEGAVYHIIARGNRKEKIFYSDKDREIFLDKMSETFIKYSFICYAYCLMDNHYHLFIKTPYANISDGMHYLNSSYANWFRVKNELVGVVFQGRYKSILVDADSYALQLSAYIHLNPLRSGLVKNIKNFKWSSYLDYIGLRKPIIEKLDTSFILEQISKQPIEAQKEYSKFVLGRIDAGNPFDDAYRGIALGDDEFIEDIKIKLRSFGATREIPVTKNVDAYQTEEIIAKISNIFGAGRRQILAKEKNNVLRSLALYLIRKYSSLSLRQIGEMFNMNYSAVSKTVRRFENRLFKDKKIQKMTARVTENLAKSNVECRDLTPRKEG